MTNKDLYEAAREVMKGAYAPYSNFKVGAALQTINGTVYTGCNIENSSYSLTCCAERVAIFQAITNGENQFSHIAIVAETEEAISPCGACRQVMAEFFTEDVKILLYNRSGEKITTTIGALLPFTFSLQKD